jgi:ankyrin repeat protein
MSSTLVDAVSAGDMEGLKRLWPAAGEPQAAAALRAAVARGKVEALQWLTAHGADVKAHAHALLHVAIQRADVRIMAVLIKAGADVNLVGPNGDPVLFEAAVQGDPEVGALLLDAGARIDAVDPRSRTTPLMESARFGAASFVDLLLTRGARKDVVDEDGHNARTLALYNLHDKAAAACAKHGIPEQPQFAKLVESTRQGIKEAQATMKKS